MIIEKRNQIRKNIPAQVEPFDEFNLGTRVNWGDGPVRGNVYTPWLISLLTASLTGIVAYGATKIFIMFANL
jgi:hypothetical protein